MDTPQVEMPRYRCHKEVWALKIEAITTNPNPDGLEFPITLHFADKAYAPLKLASEFVNKHSPQAGGYYVVYADGYKSFSPAKAFEDGYTRI